MYIYVAGLCAKLPGCVEGHPCKYDIAYNSAASHTEHHLGFKLPKERQSIVSSGLSFGLSVVKNV